MTAPYSSYHPRLPRPSHLLLRNRRLTVFAAVAALLLGLTAALRPNWLLEVDRPLSDALRGTALIEVFRTITRLGSQEDMLVVAVVLALLLWRVCKPFAVTYPAALLVGILCDVTLKVIVDRPRPPEPLVGTALGSFPSGHALTGVIFFGLLPPAVWVAFRRRSLFWVSVPLSFLLAAATLTSRVYLGAHWPSDVLASAVIGATILLVAENLLGGRFARRHCDGCPLHSPIN